jgi:predicted CoA-binding protein
MERFRNPPDDTIRRLLLDTRTIAVVGASSSASRPSNDILRYLLRAGYTVFPVNPRETEVLGQKAYPSLADLPVTVDLVDVFRRAEHTPGVAAEAVAHGAKALWLQLGIANDEAAAIAARGGLTVVMDLCIKVEHRQLVTS